MNLADFLRQGPMGQQRQANDSSFNRDADLARMSQSYGSVQAPFMDRLSTGQVPTYTGNPNDVLADSLILGDEFNRQRDAKQSEQLMNMMPGAGITAWQGSPHKFTKFDMSKIGTGEGAQAYGHGLYAAENPAVAKEYQRQLAGDGFMAGDEIFDPWKLQHLNVRTRARNGDLDGAIERAKEISLRSDDPTAKLALADLAQLEDAKALGGFKENKGYLYKMDIPDDQIGQMLDWDKPLSEQGQHIQDLFPEMVAEEAAYKAKYPSGGFGEVQGGGIYGTLSRKLNTGLSGEGAPKASEYLKSKGIPGIKYSDQGSRGKRHVQLKYKGEPYGEPVELFENQVDDFVKEYEVKGFGTEVVDQGTSNFVLFSDEIAEILERNGQPIGDLAEGLKKR